ncbi:Gfo/Idh/MocA family protein [Paenibacillus terreus]|uniref:Gfo/Idh/MocA family protein n=1 Tax=Paenibacillus terreus TaxID=1387834 RepID=A0ABV5BGD2_9BACL
MTVTEAAKRSALPLRVGMIGLDNSRVVTFARLLNDDSHPYHVAGARLVAAWPGLVSPDFPMSAQRFDGFVAELRDRQGIRMTETINEVAEQCDALMLEAVDGRTRADLFERIVAFRKPVFVDKPFALGSADAERMLARAAACGTPLMSCSALRYAAALTEGLQSWGEEAMGADFYGPLPLEPTQAGYFWYGIHTAEMLFRVLGPECVEVRARRTPDHDVIVGGWKDGRIGTIRGTRTGSEQFGGVLHGKTSSRTIEVSAEDKPYLASLLEEIIPFFATGRPPVDTAETLAIIRFLESANRSLLLDKQIKMSIS